jgi:hypothetical protein
VPLASLNVALNHLEFGFGACHRVDCKPFRHPPIQRSQPRYAPPERKGRDGCPPRPP